MNQRKARVVVSQWVHPEVGDYLAGFCDAVMPARDEGVWPQPKLAELAADAEGLMVCMADSIDEAFGRRGVWLTIVPDTLIAPTGELAIGLAIGLMRRITEGHDHVRTGGFAGWRPQLYGSTLQGATVGAVGMGELGQAVARRLAGFESQIVYHDARRLDAQTERAPAVSHHGLVQLAKTSDVIVMALPLTGQTRHLVDAALLQRMRPGAFLVNVGRGSVVSEEAVADTLEAGCLGGRRRATQDVLKSAHQIRQALEGRRPDNAVNTPRP